jgi:periplasmic copper chaperone A
MIRTRRRFLVAAGAVAGAALSAAVRLSALERVSAGNAWVPWAPPTVEVHAAYMTIVNRSNQDQFLVSAESPDYQRVELHSSSVKHGVNEMRDLDRVAVPANSRVTFEPGGLHLMLIGPKRPHAVDDRVRIVLRLQNGELVEVSAVVRRRNMESPGGHDHHGAHQ